MQSAENTEVRCLTDTELDNVGGGSPAIAGVLIIGGLTALGMYIAGSAEPDFGAKPPSWFNNML
jgi:hypothetical protein